MRRRRLMMMHIPAIPHKLHPAQHLAHGEKSQHLRQHHARRKHLPAVDVPHAAEDCFGAHAGFGRGGSDGGGWVAEDVDDRLRVGLEGCYVSVEGGGFSCGDLRGGGGRMMVERGREGWTRRTEVTFFGLGRLVWRARGRRGSSRLLVGLVL